MVTSKSSSQTYVEKKTTKIQRLHIMVSIYYYIIYIQGMKAIFALSLWWNKN